MVVLGDTAATGFSRLHAFCASTGRERSGLFRHKHCQPSRCHLIRGGLNRWHGHGLSVGRVLTPKFPLLLSRRDAVSKGPQGSLVEESDALAVYPEIIHFFRRPLLHDSAIAELLRQVQVKVSGDIVEIKTEICFNIGLDGVLSAEKLGTLKWLLQETFEPENFQSESFLEKEVGIDAGTVIVEVGPRMSFTTAWSTNAGSICRACSLTEVTRMEQSRRYLLRVKKGSKPLDEHQIRDFASLIHDRMTECVYPVKLTTFHTSAAPDPVIVIPVIERGRQALEEINLKMGLAFDEQDIQYYTRLFRDDIKRNPTTVELFDVVQSNSEHSGHGSLMGSSL